jgi:hypothetical protein
MPPNAVVRPGQAAIEHHYFNGNRDMAASLCSTSSMFHCTLCCHRRFQKKAVFVGADHCKAWNGENQILMLQYKRCCVATRANLAFSPSRLVGRAQTCSLQLCLDLQDFLKRCENLKGIITECAAENRGRLHWYHEEGKILVPQLERLEGRSTGGMCTTHI